MPDAHQPVSGFKFKMGGSSLASVVLGMFLLELLAGFLLKIHPANTVSMPLRFAGLVVAIAACYATLAALKEA